MLAKKFRLTIKEVNYILNKRQVISTPEFLFFWVPQYTNREYNQFALQLSTKVHKRSVKRNKLRRMFYNLIEQHGLLTKPSSKNVFIKTIALPHKTTIEEWNKLLTEKQRDICKTKLEQSLHKAFK